MMLNRGDLIQGGNGTYMIEEAIDRGGMSIVYLARGPDGRKVVVKMPNSLGTPYNKLIFERDLLKQLSHDHIVRYLDSSIVRLGSSSFPALIVEYSSGKTLEKAAFGRPMDEKEARASPREI
jgi:serine/threonine protein kinase